MNSAIYVGRITHQRRQPKTHTFSYRIFMLYLDLDELETFQLKPWFNAKGPGLLRFHRQDYFGGTGSLKNCVLDEVEAQTGYRPTGAVRLLTHVRTLGFVFNPVSFYYCFDADGTLAAVLSEINNTPWNERHTYVVSAQNDRAQASFQKDFHVSPFFPMQQIYHWSFSSPEQTLVVHMQNEENQAVVFGATLQLVRRAFCRSELLRVLLQQPLITWKVHFAIYIQALRLWLKRVPFYAHPKDPALSPKPARRSL